MMNRGVFMMYDEPESPDDGACLRYVMSWKRRVRGRAYISYMENRNRQMMGVFKGCLRYIMNRNRQTSGNV